MKYFHVPAGPLNAIRVFKTFYLYTSFFLMPVNQTREIRLWNASKFSLWGRLLVRVRSDMPQNEDESVEKLLLKRVDANNQILSNFRLGKISNTFPNY